MALTSLALNHQHLSLYLENEQALVFHHLKQSLFELPPLSVSLLLAIDQGLNKVEALNKVASLSGLKASALESSYQQVSKLFDKDKEAKTYLEGRYPEVEALLHSDATSTPSGLTYQVAEAAFSLAIDDQELAEEMQALLAPCQSGLAAVDFLIEVLNYQQSFVIKCNDIEVATLEHQKFVAPIIIDHMQVLSFQKSDYCYCFHGAAVQHPNGDIFLPGKSGVGKSTLAAQLSKQGYGLYSDEMIAFDKQFTIKTIPLPIAIKEGSWHLLSKQYPELLNARTWQRIDGRQIKYIWPAHFAEPSLSQKKKWLMSPYFDGNQQEAETVQLSIIDTLRLLTDGGYQVGEELSEPLFKQLLDFLSSTTREQIRFSNSAQVLDRLVKLCR